MEGHTLYIRLKHRVFLCYLDTLYIGEKARATRDEMQNHPKNPCFLGQKAQKVHFSLEIARKSLDESTEAKQSLGSGTLQNAAFPYKQP
ncbi:MAG: hypothetical protein EB060_05100 [Proteobacteria bacterium]|nr:hypothetical protein [Pseudomonadota bacterium]